MGKMSTQRHPQWLPGIQAALCVSNKNPHSVLIQPTGTALPTSRSETIHRSTVNEVILKSIKDRMKLPWWFGFANYLLLEVTSRQAVSKQENSRHAATQMQAIEHVPYPDNKIYYKQL